MKKHNLLVISPILVFVGILNWGCVGEQSQNKPGAQKIVKEQEAVEIIQAPRNLKKVLRFYFLIKDEGYGKFPIYRDYLKLEYDDGSRWGKEKFYRAEKFNKACLVINGQVLAEASKPPKR